MISFPYFADDAAGPNHPFPEEIQSDPLVLYHGTSSSNESEIETNGLLPGKSLFEVKDLVAIVELFEEMDWAGINSGSLGTLKPFSVEHDFAHAGGKPLFLAESARRASGYASLDYAGGEIARSVRNCFDDLWAYLDDASVRDGHMREVQEAVAYCKRLGAAPHPVPVITMDEIRARLVALDGVRSLACKAEAAHAYGVVYAVMLDAADLAAAKISWSMGVMCTDPIPLVKIVGKTLIPNAYVHDYVRSRPGEYVVERMEQWNSVLALDKSRPQNLPD